VAYRYRQACAAEFEFICAMLPEADVVREEYIMNGASACSYRITRRL
jgi:predicted ArsR family transcriptional regulator